MRSLFSAARLMATRSVHTPARETRSIEQSLGGERASDISSRLLKELRTFTICGNIDDDTAREVVPKLLFLDEMNNDPIRILINSSGGHATAGLAIYDIMQYIESPIETIGMGKVSSIGTLLLAAGTEGLRKSYPYTTIVIDRPDLIDLLKKGEDHFRDSLNQIYSKHIGQPVDVIKKKMESGGYLMTPQEAKEFGIIDQVLKSF